MIPIKNRIPLWQIIVQICLSLFFRIKSFLELDIKSRIKEFKRLFKPKRTMVSSDSTVWRIFRWLSVKENRRFLLKFQRKEPPNWNYRRFLYGWPMDFLSNTFRKVNLPILLEPYIKRGKELKTPPIDSSMKSPNSRKTVNRICTCWILFILTQISLRR